MINCAVNIIYVMKCINCFNVKASLDFALHGETQTLHIITSHSLNSLVSKNVFISRSHELNYRNLGLNWP
jgi:hypothetical protein